MHSGVASLLSRTLAVAAIALSLLVYTGTSRSVAAQLSQQEISQFLANPASLLSANPDGGGKLVSTVRDLALSDPATLPVIISLLANANSAQQAAIGSGLGQAAMASLRSNPTFATQIQDALAASGVQMAIASFASTTGNVQIGSTAGGAGSGGGGGGPVNGGPPSGGGGGGGGNSQGNNGSGSQGGNSQGGGGNSQGNNGGGNSQGGGSVSNH